MSGPRRTGEKAFLQTYDPLTFPSFAVTVDLNVLTIRDGGLCALLVQRREHPYRGWWALPGGRVVHGKEDVGQAALRELREETGLDWTRLPGHLEQVGTYSEPDRDPRITAGLQVISVSHLAFGPDLPDPAPGTDAPAAAARFWPVDDLDLDTQRTAWQNRQRYDGDAPALAFDHALMLSDARERVRAKIEYTTLAARFVDEPFSLRELRRVYETVWGLELDTANFRRKILSVDGFVVPDVRAPSVTTAGRPPLRYRRGPGTEISPPLLRG